MGYLAIFALLILAGMMTVNETYADIGIDVSTKCKLMIKNNLDSPCPTIEQILQLFPDTSPQDQVGSFEFIENIMMRGPSQYHVNHWYQYMKGLPDGDRIWIDPPAGARPYLQMITIESNFENYPIKGSYVMSNNTISMGTQRHVNLGCTKTILNADDWIFLTGDTIVLMNNDCDENFTNFNHIKKFYFEKSFQDIRTSYKYKLEKWFAESKIKCATVCKEY